MLEAAHRVEPTRLSQSRAGRGSIMALVRRVPAAARSNPSCATTEQCAAVWATASAASCPMYGRLCLRRPQGSDNVTGVSSSETLSGWTYGGGVEFVWNRDITLYGGYRRLDFDEKRSQRFLRGRTRSRRRLTSSTSAGSTASSSHGHFTTGGIEESIECCPHFPILSHLRIARSLCRQAENQ